MKECYYYLDATPTHSYLKALYKYPQAEFPYDRLVEENGRRSRDEPEFDLVDTGVFDGDRYFDVAVEYAKAEPEDVLIRVSVSNRGPDPAPLHLLPTLWFRNTWSWGRTGDGYWPRPCLRRTSPTSLVAEHATLGRFRWTADAAPGGPPELLFTENETNVARLFGAANGPHVKDAFDARVVHGRHEAVNPDGAGTKAAAWYQLTVPAGATVVVRLRLSADASAPAAPFDAGFDATFASRLAEADAFHATRTPAGLDAEATRVMRQAHAGLLWSKQYYYYAVREWLEGDPGQPPPPPARRLGRNSDWPHLFNRDVIAVPDKWEYPWYAAWDLAFHALAYEPMDPDFAKEQLLLFLREWYMHPRGALPAYEFSFDDMNPPVHALAAWSLYWRTGGTDRVFLARVFQKLLLTFTYWVNQKDPEGDNLFSGGFLGLDNVGVFDRSKALPTGGVLRQADGTAWIAYFCALMLAMALELAANDPAYEDMASKFFEHFVAIAEAMNEFGGVGLWDEQDGFYYDQLAVDGKVDPLRVRSVVGIIPLFAVVPIEHEVVNRLPGFRKRAAWFITNQASLSWRLAAQSGRASGRGMDLLMLPTRDRLVRVLRYVLDETEFLSPHGIRSLSKVHQERPYLYRCGDQTYEVGYEPAESTSGLFGGNSNWRGPVWFPMNILLIEALRRYDRFYGDELQVECPTGSGRMMTLGAVADELGRRLASLFLPDASGRRPCHGTDQRYASDPHWRDLVLFHEYFDGDTGRGLGASHQTGWTALAARCVANAGRATAKR